jgi:prepilin peptidase CpaA
VFSLTLVIRAIAAVVLLGLAAFDIRHRRLPNPLVMLVAGLFFVDALALQLPLHHVASHGLAALVAFAIGVAFVAAGWIGGGDAKLAGAVFLWTGTGLALPVLTLISVIGLLVALVSLASMHLRFRMKTTPRGLATMSSQRGVPYGVALALGGCAGVMLPALVRIPSQ